MASQEGIPYSDLGDGGIHLKGGIISLGMELFPHPPTRIRF